MSTPPEKETGEDVVQRRFIPLREPPGRLGAIVRRLKQMAPPPPPRSMAAEGDEE